MSAVREKLLVTGGAGLFASRILGRIQGQYELVLADLKGKHGTPVIPLDILDYNAVERALSGVDMVLHLAIATARDLSHLGDAEYADETMRVNVMGTQHVLEAAAANAGVKRVVLCSSAMATIGWPRARGYNPDPPYRTADLYGLSKLVVEQLGDLYARTRQLPVACLRVGEPWPRGEEEADQQKLSNTFWRALMVHWDDLAQAIDCALAAKQVLFSITNVVSNSDASDCVPSENSIGYHPTWCFSEGGASSSAPAVIVPRRRPRVSAICTAYHRRSHADVLLSRWWEPRPADAAWGWDGPRSDLVSGYLDQVNDDDIGVEAFERHNIACFPTVRDALTLGGDELAVDGVLLVGEHGNYPSNDIGQCLYPRKELFDQIVEVFRSSGRAVPVFCDKHLSWNIDWAMEMCETAWELRFQFFSGSSIPLCPLEPPIRLADTDRIVEAVVLFFGDDESYGYHSLEFFQAILDQQAHRLDGMAGVTAWRGDAVWDQMEAGTWSEDLFQAALDSVSDARGQKEPGGVRENCGKTEAGPSAFVVEHYRSLRATHINLQGHLRNWAVAMRLENGEIVAASPVVFGEEAYWPHFAALANMVDETISTGRAPHLLQRSFLTTAAVTAFMRARATPGVRFFTPRLVQTYNTGPCSHR